MNRTIIFLMMLGILVIPQVASAAWWNPFSWNWAALFSSPTQVEIQKPVNVPEHVVQASSTMEAKTVPVTVPKQTQPTLQVMVPVKAVPAVQQVPTPVVNIPALLLQIKDVKNDVAKEVTKITWTTSVSARSQLLLDNGEGRGYESINGVGTSHEVHIGEPVASKEYIYKIVAHTNDGKLTDAYYGSFTAVREYKVLLGAGNGECAVIRIVDTMDKPAKDMKVSIWGTYGDKMVIQIPSFEATTNEDGEIRDWPHCKTTNILYIKGDDIDVKVNFPSSLDFNGWKAGS